MAKPTTSRGAKGTKAARAEVLATDAPERIESADIAQVMRSNYQDYAAAVVVGRAIPDVRDGLKPVHRRILYTMIKEGYDWSAGYRKSARIVGSVMGLYHPHGMASAPSQQMPLPAATAAARLGEGGLPINRRDGGLRIDRPRGVSASRRIA